MIFEGRKLLCAAADYVAIPKKHLLLIREKECKLR